MIQIAVAIIISVGPIAAAFLSWRTYRDNQRGHGSVEIRLDRLEETVRVTGESRDARLDAIESSVTALGLRQDLIETQHDHR